MLLYELAAFQNVTLLQHSLKTYSVTREFWSFCTWQSCPASGHSQTLFNLRNSAAIKKYIWIYHNHLILPIITSFLMKVHQNRILVFHIILWNLTLHIKTQKVQLTCNEDKNLNHYGQIKVLHSSVPCPRFSLCMPMTVKNQRYGNYTQIINTITSKELWITAPADTSKLTQYFVSNSLHTN